MDEAERGKKAKKEKEKPNVLHENKPGKRKKGEISVLWGRGRPVAG